MITATLMQLAQVYADAYEDDVSKTGYAGTRAERARCALESALDPVVCDAAIYRVQSTHNKVEAVKLNLEQNSCP